MSTRYPSLNALRAFDAAARHMSFQRAADELHVTPAALSYQIRQLEERLDVRLFRRMNRAVALTEAGELIRINGIMQDITDRKISEDDRRKMSKKIPRKT